MKKRNPIVCTGIALLALILFGLVTKHVVQPSDEITESHLPATSSNLLEPVADEPVSALGSVLNSKERSALKQLSAGSLSPTIDPKSNHVKIDDLDSNLVLDRRVTDLGNGKVERLFLVNGGGSYPYHRIEERLHYDDVAGQYVVAWQRMIVADHILVKLREGVGEAELEQMNKLFGTNTLLPMGFANKYIVKIPSLTIDGVSEFSKLFAEKTGLVERVHADAIHTTSAIPNDTNWSSLWGKQKIDCPDAWDIQTGSTNIIVAVLDTGVDLDHPDLAAHLWKNPGEAGSLATNGIDDDANGYVDDWIGWDFGKSDNNPDDNGDADKDGVFSEGGHGTHCSGIIGAIGNNGSMVAGVCWNVTIMALKPFEYLSSTGDMRVYSSKAEAAMQYATDNGARVTSNSYGGFGDPSTYYDGVNYQNTHDVLFIAAAGNEGTDTDITAYRPSGVDLPNVISVASSDNSESLSWFSNYGTTTVDIVAPGSSIRSTIPGGSTGLKSGTSMACPQVAGAAALLYSQNPALDYLDCRQALMDGVESFTAYTGKCVSNGRLNMKASLDIVAGNDYDNDGLPNNWEWQFFAGPTNGIPTAICANGINTVMDAYIAGFDPTAPSAGFNVNEFSYDTAGLGGRILEWNAVSGRVYTIFWTPNLRFTDFDEIKESFTGNIYTDMVNRAESVGFYRIEVNLAPSP